MADALTATKDHIEVREVSDDHELGAGNQHEIGTPHQG